LYRDASGYIFMEKETFEQYTISAEACGDTARFLRENDVCQLLFWNNQLIEMTPPAQSILEVTYAEPAAKGNTATNVTKPATVETGATVQVPAFVETGDKIKINAQTGEYIERSRD
jgi:elongation factor P